MESAIQVPEIHRPSSREELIPIVQQASRRHQAVIPRGSGTHQRMGHPPADSPGLLHTTGLNRIVDFSEKDFTVTVETGITLEELQKKLEPFRQFFPYGGQEEGKRTIGGIIATGTPNLFSYRYRDLRDLVLGLAVCQADGTVLKAGGKVIKNVSGYDMQKLFIGSFGTLGLTLEATLRLYPIPQKTWLITGRTLKISQGIEILKRIFSSTLPVSAAYLTANASRISVCACVQGKQRSVTDMAEKVKWIFRNCQILALKEIEGNDPFSFPENQEILGCGKIPPSMMPTAYQEISRVSEALKISPTLLFSLDGFFRIGWDGKIPDHSISEFEKLNQKIAAMGGWIVYRQVPASVWNDWPMWGPERPEWETSLRLKKEFDGEGLWNRGRFLRRT